MNWSDETMRAVAISIIVARDGKCHGERRFKDPVIRKAYIDDAKTALAAIEQSKEWADKPCPNVITGKDGTSHCALAASGMGALQDALKVRSKQIGVACMKHDLTHRLACGHCYKQLQDALEQVCEAATALADDFSEYYDDSEEQNGERLHTVYNMRKILSLAAPFRKTGE